MQFNLNEFLISISFALDFAEMDILGNKTNHSKRVAYISFQLGKQLGLSTYELFDLVSLSIIHDNGIGENALINEVNQRTQQINSNDIALYENINSNRIVHEHKKAHCMIGNNNIINFPFYTCVDDVILYHHENYNGTGFFHKKGSEIPLMSQIIHFADTIDNFCYLPDIGNKKQDLLHFVKQSSNILFSEQLVNIFLDISNKTGFWLDIKENFIDITLKKCTPNLTAHIELEKIYELTKVYSKLVDSKSSFTQTHSEGLAKKAQLMADYYLMDKDTKYKFIIAARLHDIGKLAISNSILNKPGSLTADEIDLIQKHTYYTRISLSQIKGFEEITEWASNHHEKLDGSGYPYGLVAKDLDFNSRLMACLDIYQALTENRPYRQSLTHCQASKILLDMSSANKLDYKITRDILTLFKNYSFK